MPRTCLLVICAAPLARRAPDVARALVEDGWTVLPVATPAAADGWVDHGALAEITGSKVRSSHRSVDQPKVRSRPDAVVVCPLTFNTIGKLANGIADNYALSAVSEAMGAGVPSWAVPIVNESLWTHVALAPNIERLVRGGLRLVNAANVHAQAEAVQHGTGEALTDAFSVTDLVALLHGVY